MSFSHLGKHELDVIIKRLSEHRRIRKNKFIEKRISVLESQIGKLKGKYPKHKLNSLNKRINRLKKLINP